MSFICFIVTSGLIRWYYLQLSGLKKLPGERNALHRAAGYGHLNIVIELIKAGFNPLTASHTGRIPLHEACQGLFSLFCMFAE